MDSSTLVNFPIPMLTALLCATLAVLVWRLDLGVTRAAPLFALLFGLCALESLLVGLRFGYGIVALIPLQRTLPLFLGPLMYLGFLSFRLDQRNLTTALVIHLSAPAVVLAVFQILVGDLRALDWVISASYLFYMCALFLLWRRGPDALICAPVGRTNSLSNWMLRALGLLVFVFLLDTTIALDFELNKGANVATLISYGTLPLIAVSLVVLLTLPAMLAPAAIKPRATQPADRKDAEVEERLCNLLTDEQLFLDPDLTVQRLAKRLHLPARDVSVAVNRCKGLNVSQYVNEFRVAHAAALMSSSADSITRIAQRSGFLSRSNFYREFQRVFDQSPTEFRTSKPRADIGSKSD